MRVARRAPPPPAVAARAARPGAAETGASAATPALALAAVCVLAAAIRFATLDVQSFWLDETFTVALVRRPLGDMLSVLPHAEDTPPLYFILAWLWTQVFGSGEVGLRALSALIGTATVPVAYMAGRELVSRRAGLVTAMLVAVHPWLVWYSQEARSYALLVLLTATGLVFFSRALDGRRRSRNLALWAVVSTLALATHYFAAFVVLGEAVWLFAAAPAGRGRRLAPVVAIGAFGAAGVALLPLVLEQRSAGTEAFGRGAATMVERAQDLIKKLLNGELGGAFNGQAAVAGVLALSAVWFLWRGTERERRAALVAGSLALCVALPIPLAAVGLLLPPPLRHPRRNPGAPVRGSRVRRGTCGSGRAGRGGGAHRHLAGHRRPRGARSGLAARRLAGGSGRAGPPAGGFAVVVSRDYETAPLTTYLRGATPLPPAGADVREVDVIQLARGGSPPPLRPRGFIAVAVRRTTSYELVRFRASVATRVAPATLAPLGTDPGLVLQVP